MRFDRTSWSWQWSCLFRLRTQGILELFDELKYTQGVLHARECDSTWESRGRPGHIEVLLGLTDITRQVGYFGMSGLVTPGQVIRIFTF